MRWDLFCRVIDNYGDIGVCWRLASNLQSRGEQVRLWVDDPSALGWMAPLSGESGVEVLAWSDPPPPVEPGDVVIEAFGCDPPTTFVRAMQARAVAPVWINLEYLSAEAYVARSHGLPSPQFTGAAAGLTKWFFYPGFSEGTGGLMREPGLLAERRHFNRDAWLRARGWERLPEEDVIVLFSYPNAPLAGLLDQLASSRTMLLVAAGCQAPDAVPGSGLRIRHLPRLSQADFDRLLWSADLNFVRGEDSFVRAQWAAAPFVWQIYPQSDGAHKAKLQAFMDGHLLQADPTLKSRLLELWRAWNGLHPWPPDLAWPDLAAWRELTQAWRDQLAGQADLVSQLIGFVDDKRRSVATPSS